MSHETMAVAQMNPNLQRNWKWLLGLGIVFIILGCIGLGMEVGLTIVSVLFFGALLILAGLTHIVDVIKHKEWKGMILEALIAVFYIVGGLIIFYDPVLASAIITALLAGILIVIGITRLLMAFYLKDTEGWGWILFAGIISLILGFLILAQWPISGLWVIGMFIAIELIVTGWTYVFTALALRKA